MNVNPPSLISSYKMARLKYSWYILTWEKKQTKNLWFYFRQFLIPSLHIIVKAHMRSKSVSQNSLGQSFKTSLLHRGMKPTCTTNRKHQSRNNLKPNKQKKITISVKTLLPLRLLNYLLDPETQAKLLFFTPYSIAC